MLDGQNLFYFSHFQENVFSESACKNLKSYNNPFYGFEWRLEKNQKNTLNSGHPKMFIWAPYQQKYQDSKSRNPLHPAICYI